MDRLKQFRVMLSIEEHASLLALARQAGLSASDLLRQWLRAAGRVERSGAIPEVSIQARGPGEGNSVRTPGSDKDREFWERWERNNPGVKRPT